jgi:tripartite-type tricarboxylate transporter receptor subunit TctC
MKSLPRRLAGLALAACAVALAPAAAPAQDYPTRPIRVIVPFPPGGPTDIIARVIAQRMSEILGQVMIIENRGGAGGMTGTDTVAKADGDGYTLGVTTVGALAISASLQEKVPYDPIKDFKPITLLATVPELLAVANDIPVSDMAELVALAKAKPGQLSFGSSGPGSMPHLAGELFKVSTGIDIVHVPYRGAAPAVNDLLGQQVQMVFFDVPVLLPHVLGGTIKPIAVGSTVRSSALPNVPTTAEAGYPAVVAENWHGLVAPASTPPAIIAKLNRAAVEAIQSPQVHAKLLSQGAVLVGNTPEEFAALIRGDIDKWAKVIKAAGVKPE